jgi:nicotinamidase/pyrazinamidase
MNNSALIIVGLQNDFLEGGSVSVPDSLQIIFSINKFKRQFKNVIFIKDWHQKNHSSFKKYEGIWSTHCIQDTYGSELHKFVDFNESSDIIIHKGTNKNHDSYSAFYNSKEIEERTQLNNILKKNNINKIYICGLPIEYDVYSTALDAYKQRYECYIIKNAISGYDKKKSEDKLKYLEKLGIKIVEL